MMVGPTTADCTTPAAAGIEIHADVTFPGYCMDGVPAERTEREKKKTNETQEHDKNHCEGLNLSCSITFENVSMYSDLLH